MEGLESREESRGRNKNKKRVEGVERVIGDERLGLPCRTRSSLAGFR